MPTYTDEQIKSSQDLLANGQDLYQRANQEIGAINSTSLTPAPQFKLPEKTPTPSLAPALGGYFDEYAKQFGVQEAESNKNNSLDALIGSLVNTRGQTALTADAYNTGGVDNLGLELKDLNNQLLGEQQALKNELSAIEKNPEGLTLGALKDRMNDAKTASLRRQSDIAVVQMAKQGQYDSAKDIADRAIAAQLEKDKQRNEILQFVYNENKSLYDKKEQRAFETAQADRERELENKEYRLRLEYDAKIKQADPLYQANLAKAKYDLFKAYTDGMPKQATPLQIAKLQNNIIDTKGLAKNPALRGAVGTTPFGRFAPIQAFTGDKSNFIASVQQLTQQLTLENLQNAKANGATFGALSEGELDLLRESGTKINSWAVKDESGKVIGYKTDDASFQRELDRINYYQQLDYLAKGGDPASAGIVVSSDGKFWAENSDDTLSELVPEL